MFSLYKKELQSYFLSPAAYAVLAFFTLTFSLTMIMDISEATELYQFSFTSIFYANLFYLVILFPVLTMRSFSEERKNGTEVLLLSSPISVTKIVLAKFMATATVFLIMMVISLFYPIITALNGNVIVSSLICTYVGFYLFGLVCIALGILISSFTESIILSIIMSEAAMILLLLVDNISAYTFFGSIPVLSSLLQWLSNQQKFIVFSNGYMQISDLFAYITEIAVFLILTVISVEKRRWSRR
jgi:ABC-2 type transport system permease protein